MAISIRFDVNRRAQVHDQYVAGQGIQTEIRRQCIVTGIPVSGPNDPSVLIKCAENAAFPQLGQEHPDPTVAFAVVQERIIRSIDVSTNTVDCDIFYRGIPPIPIGGGIPFTLTQGSQTSTVQWYATAGASTAIKIWYDPGLGDDGDEGGGLNDPSDNATTKSVSTQKIITGEILKASAMVSRSTWDAYKADFRSTRGCINGDSWGSYPRGQWLSLGPSTRTMDSVGNQLFVEITFLSNDKLWFPIDVWRDPFGNIPDDIDPESALRNYGPPAAGTYNGLNGIVWSSIYSETAFSPIFGFTPE